MKSKRKQYQAQFYRKNKLRYFLAILSALLIASVNLGLAWLLQQMIDTVSGVQDAYSLTALALLTVGIILLIFAFKALNYISMPRFMETAMRQYKDYVFEKLTQKSIAAFSSENTAQYLSAFSNDAATIESGYLKNQFLMIANMLTLVGALTMMLLYNPIMTVTACAFFSLPIGVSFLTGHRMENVEREVSEQNSAFVATLKDCLSGFSVMKSFRAEAALISLFGQSNRTAEQAKCKERKLYTIINAFSGAAGVAAQLGTFLVGAWLAHAGFGVTPGILIVFIDLTANVINPIQELPEQLASRKAALALIDKLADSLDSNIRDEGTAIPDRLEHGIVLKDVSFGYETEKTILQDIHAHFDSGKSYAIVGASGSGKSTLLNLLMASHGNYSGQITYDGHEVRDVSSESLYTLVSVIQQNVFVFNASIRDNVTMFHDFPKSEVDRAIALSGLSELIAERGENYLCGENGNGLSGGERQRIAIARSLLKKSQVLLVDEATAALDAATAYQVSRSILDLNGITRIVVTHSLDATLLRQYDGILTLKNGRIEEAGTFDELMKQKGYFYSLFTVSQ